VALLMNGRKVEKHRPKKKTPSGSNRAKFYSLSLRIK